MYRYNLYGYLINGSHVYEGFTNIFILNVRNSFYSDILHKKPFIKNNATKSVYYSKRLKINYSLN